MKRAKKEKNKKERFFDRRKEKGERRGRWKMEERRA